MLLLLKLLQQGMLFLGTFPDIIASLLLQERFMLLQLKVLITGKSYNLLIDCFVM
jgi:hypothetical protein